MVDPMTDVRALTLWQPWASLVAVGAKTIETRTKQTQYRGRLLIHAGKRWEPGVYGEWIVPAASDLFMYRDGEPPMSLPLGAVVASAMLTGCVPIVDVREAFELCDRAEPCVTAHGGVGTHYRDDRRGYSVTDQLPFGDFTPGRWAWLLDDVKPTTERCPRCWGSGFDPDPPAPTAGNNYYPCVPCDGNGRCEPVPMRGRQRLWAPTWERAS